MEMVQLQETHPRPGREFTLLVAAMMAVTALSIDTILPALGIISREMALANANHAQFLVGGIFIGMGSGQLLAGPLSDALGRKRVLYIGLCIHLIGSLVCLFAPSFPVLLVGRVLQGLGAAGPYVTAVSIVRDKYAGRAMAKVMSLVMMVFIMVPAIAPSLGQGIMLLAGWRDIFIMYMVYALAITGWVFFRLEETLPREKRVPFNPKNLKHGLREVLKNRLTVSYTLCMGISFGSLMGYINSAQQIFQEHFAVGQRFTIYFGLLAMVIGVASLVNSRIVQRLGMRYIVIRGMGTVIVASTAFLLLHLLVEPTLPMFMAYAAVMFFCFGLVHGNLNALAMEPMGHIAGLAAAIIGFTSSMLSMSIGAVIGQSYNDTLVPLATGFAVLFSIALGIVHYAARQPFVEAK